MARGRRVPPPSRVNAAGVCRYCLRKRCERVSCVATHKVTVWRVCEACKGTEYINGHRFPDEAFLRCWSCFGGLVASIEKRA